MIWSAYAAYPNGHPLPTTFIDGHVELMGLELRATFHRARDRVLTKTELVDPDLHCGGLYFNGSGRVLSLLAGHGGSLSRLTSLDTKEVSNLLRGADLLDLDFVTRELAIMGFTEDYPILSYYWSAIEFVKACVSSQVGFKCYIDC